MTTVLTREAPTASTFQNARRGSSFLNLGLDCAMDAHGAVNRLSGLRCGRVVEIRFPAADYESATWVLASAPRFETVLGDWATLPASIALAIGDVPVFAPLWEGLRIRGSDLGLTALRRGVSPLPHAFMHDLWLLERIVERLDLLPVPAGDLRHEPLPGGSASPGR
jgi:hypothetical protein